MNKHLGYQPNSLKTFINTIEFCKIFNIDYFIVYKGGETRYVQLSKFEEWCTSLTNDRPLVLYAEHLSRFSFHILNSDIFKNWEKDEFFFLNEAYFLRFKKNKHLVVFKSFSLFFKRNREVLRDKFKVTLFPVVEKVTDTTTGIGHIRHNLVEMFKLLSQLNSELLDLNLNWNLYNFSIAGTALSIFKRKFNTQKVRFSQSYKDYFIFKEAFYGGRNEVFGNPIRGEFLYHFDFSLMYGNIMKNEDFYYGDYEERFDKTEIDEPGFYFITYFDNSDIPVLPRKTIKHGLVFPNGHGEGLYWWELIKLFEAVNEGRVTSIKKAYILKKKGKIFQEFANTLINRRASSDFNKVVYKDLLVSFFGRLGLQYKKSITTLLTFQDYQNLTKHELGLIINEQWFNTHVLIEKEDERFTRFQLTKEYVIEKLQILFSETDFKNISQLLNSGKKTITKELMHFFKQKNKYFIQQNIQIMFPLTPEKALIEQSFNKIFKTLKLPYNPIKYQQFIGLLYKTFATLQTKTVADVKLSAQITAKGQIKLFKTILELKKHDIRLLYVDTDSLYIASRVNLNGKTIGGISWDNSQRFEDAVFISNKFYSIKWDATKTETKIAGIQQVSSVNFDTLKEGFYTTTNKAQAKKTLLHRDTILTFLVFNHYKKRHFSSNKKNTYPVHNEELEPFYWE